LQGANLSFADGHVEHWRWAYPKKVQVVPQLAANSQDLKDMRRLQACMKPAD
jgi:prepilin-type processing-associated H-X9-DG protein